MYSSGCGTVQERGGTDDGGGGGGGGNRAPAGVYRWVGYGVRAGRRRGYCSREVILWAAGAASGCVSAARIQRLGGCGWADAVRCAARAWEWRFRMRPMRAARRARRGVGGAGVLRRGETAVASRPGTVQYSRFLQDPYTCCGIFLSPARASRLSSNASLFSLADIARAKHRPAVRVSSPRRRPPRARCAARPPPCKPPRPPSYSRASPRRARARADRASTARAHTHEHTRGRPPVRVPRRPCSPPPPSAYTRRGRNFDVRGRERERARGLPRGPRPLRRGGGASSAHWNVRRARVRGPPVPAAAAA